MKTINGVRDLGSKLAGSVVTIGNFDGVHLGHREIVSDLVASAKRQGVPSVVMTFHPHPREVLFPDQEFYRIFEVSDQVETLDRLGVDLLVIEPFSRELSQTTALEFFNKYVLEPLNPKSLLVGYDFAFGADRKGSQALLERLSQELSFELKVIPAFKMNGEIVSSTLIREKVMNGNVSAAKALLGRPFYLRGLVEKGDGRGKSIGVPTANLNTAAMLIPKTGVYATRTHVNGKNFDSVTNVGRNPTFLREVARPRVETHIFEFTSDIYGQPVSIQFLDRIRDEMKFSSKESLVDQIKKDIVIAKGILKDL